MDVERYEIEPNDVGLQRENYLGHRHRTYMFLSSDVSRHIEVTSAPNWTCWSFTTNIPMEPKK